METSGDQTAVPGWQRLGTSRAVLAAGLLALSGVWLLAPLDLWLGDVVRAVEAAPVAGPLVFGATYLITALVLVPSTILTLAAGAIWGLWRGVVILHVVSVFADVVMFWVAKRGIYPRIAERELGANGELLARIDAAFERDGFLLAVLIRWFPLLPTNVVNYLLGTTKLSMRDYVWATILGTIPNSFAFVYVGALATERSRATISSDPVLVATGLVLAVVSMIGLMVYARRVIRLKHGDFASQDVARAPTWNVVGELNEVPGLVWELDLGLFQSRPYLEAAIATDPRVTWRFAVLHRGDDVVAFVPLQSFEVDPIEHVSALDPERADDGAQRIGRRFAAFGLRRLNRRVLILGNCFSSGVPGWWSSGHLSTKATTHELLTLMRRVSADLNASTLMVKDVVLAFDGEVAERWGYRAYDVDPVMELRIADSWSDYDDYLASLKSRYRLSARQARDAAKDVVRRSLSPAELHEMAPRLDELQAEILQRGAFVPVSAVPTAFAHQQECLPERCQTVGYFLGDQLIGFNTRYITECTLYSHVFGVDGAVARDFDLYRNIMLDDLEAAIEHGCAVLHLGRTSQSFKSGLGATEAPTVSWSRHRYAPGQLLIRAVLRFITAPEWARRNPYRDDIELTWRSRT